MSAQDPETTARLTELVAASFDDPTERARAFEALAEMAADSATRRIRSASTFGFLVGFLLGLLVALVGAAVGR